MASATCEQKHPPLNALHCTAQHWSSTGRQQLQLKGFGRRTAVTVIGELAAVKSAMAAGGWEQQQDIEGYSVAWILESNQQR